MGRESDTIFSHLQCENTSQNVQVYAIRLRRFAGYNRHYGCPQLLR